MILERHIGGESQGRSFFGGKRNKPRSVGLGTVFLLGCGATMVWQGPGLLVTLLAAALVWVATLNTHFGSPWKRIEDKRRWKRAVKAGLDTFVPVERRPVELEERWANATRREQGQLKREWMRYRDWPDGAEGMNWLQAEPRKPGIIWHTPRGQQPYLSVCFPVGGQIEGLEADSAINAAAQRFGRMLAGWSSATALVSGVQMLTHVLPVDSARHEQWVNANLDLTSPVVLRNSYKEVVRATGRGALMQRHFVVVRWPVTGAFRLAAERRGPGEEGWRLLMAKEIDAARRRLHNARLQPGEALSAARTSAVLRHLQMPSWPIDQAGDAPVRWPWLASQSTWSYVEVRDHGPEGQVESWFHRTLRIPIDQIATAPRSPLWLLPFLTRLSDDVIRTISIEMELVPAKSARASARSDLASDLADLSSQQQKGALTNEDLEVAKEAANARRNDLRPGGGAAGVGFAMYVSVAARSESELADACTVVEECLTTDLDIETIEWLDPDQSSAAATCWPLARGMRPVEQSSSDKIMAFVAGRGRKESLT